MKPLFEMSERERAAALSKVGRDERLEEFKRHFRRKYPGKSEAFYKRMAVRKMAMEEVRW